MINMSFMKILYVIFRKNSAKKLLVPLISCASPQELLDWGADATLACHGGATAYEAGGCHAVRRCLAKETRWNCLPLRCSSLSFGAQRDLWYFLQSEISRNLRKVPGAAIPSLPVSNWALPQTQTITEIMLKPSLSLRILESFSSMRGNWQCTWNCRLLYTFWDSFVIQTKSGSGGTATAWWPEEPRRLLCLSPEIRAKHCLPQRVDKPAIVSEDVHEMECVSLFKVDGAFNEPFLKWLEECNWFQFLWSQVSSHDATDLYNYKLSSKFHVVLWWFCQLSGVVANAAPSTFLGGT